MDGRSRDLFNDLRRSSLRDLFAMMTWYAVACAIFLKWRDLAHQYPSPWGLLLLTFCAGWTAFGAGFGVAFKRSRLVALLGCVGSFAVAIVTWFIRWRV